MDETTIRNVIEAALLAAGGPVSLDKLVEVFASRGAEVGKPALKDAIAALGNEYEGRGIEIKEVASGYRIQVRSSARDWLQPLFEERAPRYTRALLETLALIAYRQPITRAEIEEVRGVAVSSNIVRTLMERGWIRVVGFRDVPGKPSMLGTTREFLDYFGLRKLDDLPTLAEIKDSFGALSPQEDFLESLEAAEREQARAVVEHALDESAGDVAAADAAFARAGAVEVQAADADGAAADAPDADAADVDAAEAEAADIDAAEARAVEAEAGVEPDASVEPGTGVEHEKAVSALEPDAQTPREDFNDDFDDDDGDGGDPPRSNVVSLTPSDTP